MRGKKNPTSTEFRLNTRPAKLLAARTTIIVFTGTTACGPISPIVSRTTVANSGALRGLVDRRRKPSNQPFAYGFARLWRHLVGSIGLQQEREFVRRARRGVCAFGGADGFLDTA